MDKEREIQYLQWLSGPKSVVGYPEAPFKYQPVDGQQLHALGSHSEAHKPSSSASGRRSHR